MDGVFVAAGVALQLSFAAGPGPTPAPKLSLHGGLAAQSYMTQPKPAAMPDWAFQLSPNQSAVPLRAPAAKLR